ncbi:hypothetical protein L7F22_024273 [Adiantum nelumboides]|nr:hypothetical protein [Adiantum nelumboides]
MGDASSAPGSDKNMEIKKFALTNTKDIVNHFSTSGASVCVATAATHPLDVVKVRLQLEHVGQRASSSGMAQKWLNMVQSEGPQSLYKGVVPALMRSAMYGGLRLGLYEPCKGALNWVVDSSNIVTKVTAGALSGAIATATTNPLEVLKVRMQVSRSVSNGKLIGEIRSMMAREGLSGLWRGVGPSMARASALTASQLATYDESKQIIKHWMLVEEGFWLHISASFAAGVVGTTTTAPIDTVKTRMMIQRESAGALYKNAFDCAYKICTSEGLLGLYKGWSAMFARLGPQTAITFLVYEKLRQLVGISALSKVNILTGKDLEAAQLSTLAEDVVGMQYVAANGADSDLELAAAFWNLIIARQQLIRGSSANNDSASVIAVNASIAGTA